MIFKPNIRDLATISSNNKIEKLFGLKSKIDAVGF